MATNQNGCADMDHDEIADTMAKGHAQAYSQHPPHAVEYAQKKIPHGSSKTVTNGEVPRPGK